MRWRGWSVLVLLISAFGAARGAAQNHPFATHPLSYAAGSILPGHVAQAVLDQTVRSFYDAWKQEYLSLECGPGRYVVLTGVSGSNLTVSEAHGYGMILAAFMAGHDPDARAIFDGMYAYFREHPTASHANLMSWNQSQSCSDSDGQDSASDGDLDIAYALLLADKQWGSCGPINYLNEALSVLADIKAGALDATAQYVLLGDWVLPDDAPYYASTRSSDFMPDHYRSFHAASSDAAWEGLRARTYQIVNELQTNYSPVSGLIPDFIINPLTAAAPAPPQFLEGGNDGAYDYNACRDPWRLATDFLVSGEPLAQAAVQTINTWIRAATANAPANIRSGYQLDGSASPGSDYLSMAFVAPLGVGAMVDSSNQAWLDSIWDLMVATPIAAEGYYENTLKLLSMVVMSGNWWAPQSVSGGCVDYGNSICTNGGYISGVKLRLSGLGKGSGRQGLNLRGGILFPVGTPVLSFADGAQILVEDMGSGGSAAYELSSLTTPVPRSTQAGCDPKKDIWKIMSHSTVYKNRSGALDAPTCTAGSAAGLRRIKYIPGTNRDLRFDIQAKRTTFASPTGPLRVTVVLGDSAAAGAAGDCAMSATLACTVRSSAMLCE